MTPTHSQLFSFNVVYCPTHCTGMSFSRHLPCRSTLSATLFYTTTISVTPQLTSDQSLLCPTYALSPDNYSRTITRPLSLTFLPPFTTSPRPCPIPRTHPPLSAHRPSTFKQHGTQLNSSKITETHLAQQHERFDSFRTRYENGHRDSRQTTSEIES